MRDLLTPPVVAVVLLLAALGLLVLIAQVRFEIRKRREYRESYRMNQQRERERDRQYITRMIAKRPGE